MFGLGYVGFTTMCCLAKDGHEVIGFDSNSAKIDLIAAGESPIVEPEVAELLISALKSNRISVLHDTRTVNDFGELAIVCVGTPSSSDGTHDMTHIVEVSRRLAAALKGRTDPLTVAYRSTIRPGTMENMIAPIYESVLGADFRERVELVYNPEFLRESTAVQDYYDPPKIVIGTVDGAPSARMAALYEKIDARMFTVAYREAEMTKFVDNAWHALKVAFANEVGRVCLGTGVSAAGVHEIFASDSKLNISDLYTRPGGAFGGSCLPKDVRALQAMARNCAANTHLIDSLLPSNEAHKAAIFELATEGLEPRSSVLLVGLAFKAGTDDVRDSPHVDLARRLIAAGHKLSIYDPNVEPNRLIGANLGYAYDRLPMIASLFLRAPELRDQPFDRVLIGNALNVDSLGFSSTQDIVNLSVIP